MSWRNHYSEKRDFIRMSVNTEASLVIESRTLSLTCVDLSTTGARLICHADSGLEAGQQGVVTISSGGGTTTPLVADASVVRVSRTENESEDIAVTLTNLR